MRRTGSGLSEPTAQGAPRVGNDHYSVVAWEFDASDDNGIDDLWPSYRPVRVEGVTIVHHDQPDDPTTWRYYRYVDWNGVAAQLGASRGRSSVRERVERRDQRPGQDPPAAYVNL